MAEPHGESAAWSAWYVEAADTFAEFAHQVVGEKEGTGLQRQLSSRQISGQFDEVVAKNWEEDWEDEDKVDSFETVCRLMESAPR
jgi:hypothetical protein